MEDADDRLSNLSVPELISILRTSFRMSVFDRVEKVLVARERRLKKELDKRKKLCHLLRGKKHMSSLDEEKDECFELEHAKKGFEDNVKFWKRRWEESEPRVSLLEKNFPKISDWEANMISSSEQLGAGIGEMTGEKEASEKCKNRNANSAERKEEGQATDSNKKEQTAAAKTFCKRATSSKTLKVDHVIDLEKKPGMKRKRSLFANSSDEKVTIDDDDDDKVTESSKSSKKPHSSNTDLISPFLLSRYTAERKEACGRVESLSCRSNETEKMNTWRNQGGTSSNVCEENSLLKPIPLCFSVDSDDDISLDDSSSSSDSDDDIRPLLFSCGKLK